MRQAESGAKELLFLFGESQFHEVAGDGRKCLSQVIDVGCAVIAVVRGALTHEFAVSGSAERDCVEANSSRGMRIVRVLDVGAELASESVESSCIRAPPRCYLGGFIIEGVVVADDMIKAVAESIIID